MIYCTNTIQSDLVELFENMRPDDLLECQLGAGDADPLEELQVALYNGFFKFVTVKRAGYIKELVAVGGYDPESGMVFLLSTNLELTPKDKRQFYILIKQYRDYVLKTAPLLWNEVLESNVDHIRLLKTLGATFGERKVINGWGFLTFNIGGDLWA